MHDFFVLRLLLSTGCARVHRLALGCIIALMLVTMSVLPPVRGETSAPAATTFTATVLPFGEVERLKELRIKFSEPVVAQSDVKLFRATTEFATITPAVKGVWHFEDQNTLVFTSVVGAFKMASTYHVTVPAKIRSLSGSRLEKREGFEITTAAARPYQFYPDLRESFGNKPLIVAKYNQAIDRKSAFALVSLTAGVKSYPLRMLSPSEYQDRGIIYGADVDITKPNLIAFEPISPLLTGTSAVLKFAAGCPSLEGPNLSTRDREFEIKIGGPLTFKGAKDTVLTAQKSNSVEFKFSADLDAAHIDWSCVEITPPLAGASIKTEGSSIFIGSVPDPFTTYQIRFKKGLPARSGEKLGTDIVTLMKSGGAEPSFDGLRRFVSIPTSQKPVLTINRHAMPEFDLTVYKVGPEEWDLYKSGADRFKSLSKATVLEQRHVKDGRPNGLVEVDLTRYLTDGSGQFVVLACCKDGDWHDKGMTASWVQVSDLAIDVFCKSELIAFVTNLKTGLPVSGATVTAGKDKSRTDENGIAKITLTQSTDLVTARYGHDISLLMPRPYRHNWSSDHASLAPNCWLFTDNVRYQPGDSVFVKGYIQQIAPELNEKSGDSKINYEVSDARGDRILSGETSIDHFGSFDLKIPLAQDISPGEKTISISKYRPVHYPFQSFERNQTTSFFVGPASIEPTGEIKSSSDHSGGNSVLERYSMALNVVASSLLWSAGQPNDWTIWISDSKGIPHAGIFYDVTISKIEEDQKESVVQCFSLVSGKVPDKIAFEPLSHGLYRFKVQCKNASVSVPKSQLFYFFDDKSKVRIKSETSNLVTTDSLSYKLGEQIKVTISPSFYPASGIVIVSSEGIDSVQHFYAAAGPVQLQLPTPNTRLSRFVLHAYVCGQNNRYSLHERMLDISNPHGDLTLIARAKEIFSKGKRSCTMEINALDRDGHPLKAGQVLLAVYEKSGGAVSPSPWVNPFKGRKAKPATISHEFSRFYLLPPAGARIVYPDDSLASYVYQRERGLLDMDEILDIESSNRNDNFDQNGIAEILNAENKLFRQYNLVLFSPKVELDADGKASVSFDLPVRTAVYQFRAVVISEDYSIGQCEGSFVTVK